MICCIPLCKSSLSAVLHAFPNPLTENEKFHIWVKHTGLVGEEANHIFKNRRICHLHFDKIYHYPKNRLSKLAIPTRCLPDDNDVNCTDVEYLEEADSDVSDNTADVKRVNLTQPKEPDTEDPTIMFDQDFKLTLDDVDFLFLSYARTFRSLAKQFQTMLKLDIAKLFARYEMKNNMNTEEGSKREKPASESVKPSPVEIDPPPAVTPPESVVKPPQFVVKPTQFFVKSSQFVVKPSPEKAANFIPAKEANKKIFRRVPLQAVMSGVIAKTITASPQATLAKPKETAHQTNELEKSTVNKYVRVGNIPKQFDPTVNIERLKTDASMPSSQSESLQPPAPKVMKYYVPKKGPAYAIFSKDSVPLQQETLDPDLDMEVTRQVRTETVFVPTDHVGYCEEEEAGDSSDSSS
ncbi:hypothetical protein ABMA27_003401 [Loxostege sticticalis]|uniref:THAP-type domain-containing protein n=1 Tax=Loxostege sticticalis TaxID=481309 RepID=A0ABR3HT18_LOXSC